MCPEGAPRSTVHTVNIFEDFSCFCTINIRPYYLQCPIRKPFFPPLPFLYSVHHFHFHFSELCFPSILKNFSLRAMAAAASTSAGLRAISASVKLLPASSAPILTSQKSLLFKPSDAFISQNLRLTAAPATAIANGRRSFTCKSQASPADSGSSKCLFFFSYILCPKLLYFQSIPNSSNSFI